METATTNASTDAASAPAGSSSNGAKQAINSTPAAVDVNDSNAPPSRPTAQPQAPQTPSVKQAGSSITTSTERERAAREVLQALTASSSLACSKAASQGDGGGNAYDPFSARRVLFTADDADSEEDFASDDSDAVDRALRRARGRAAAAGRGGGGAAGRRAAAAASRTAATGTATAGTAAPKASSLQPANASARRLDAVFDGALRQAYFYGNGNGGEGDDGYNDFEDNAAGNGGGGGGGGGNSSGKGNNGGPSSSSSSLAARNRDKSDRATVETVLDPRTRLVLFKLLNNGVFASIHGCVSTGKEANVYLALPGPSKASSPFSALAVKVYKTSILAFKDRERYVEGDARFSGSNAGGGGFGGGGGKARRPRQVTARATREKWSEPGPRRRRGTWRGSQLPASEPLLSSVCARTF